MVRREKQIKPSGGGRDQLEAIQSCPNTRSPLVALPAEIQGIITSHLVQFRDLNHLCCTCKTLNAVVLPTLYRTIELKVPLQWSQLPSLENLLASSSEGLKYTTCLKISTAQYRQEDNIYCNLDEDIGEHGQESGDEEEPVEHARPDDAEEDSEGEGDDQLFRVSHPEIPASNALNAFIRVLIVKLRPQQLHTFWWEHACSLDALTLSIVLKHQRASIRTLNFGQYNGNWGKADLAKMTMEDLTTLGIGEVGTSTGVPWALELLARNYQKLRHLRLGTDEFLATDYAAEGVLDSDERGRIEQTDIFAELMKVKVAALNETSTPRLRLESLSLTGLDLNAFAKGFFEPVIDFKGLSVLTLESCACLEAALPLLMGTGTGKRREKSALRLRTLAIRHENLSNECSRELRTFLVSLKPLTHLHVLLEGNYDEIIDLHKVLQVHGTCLRSLVWDERAGPRSEVREDSALLPDLQKVHLELRTIAKHCPGLKALGISLEWGGILQSEKSHKKIASSFSRLNQLQTLNIRNLPEARTSETWLPNNHMMIGLAEMLLGIITKNGRIQQAQALKTLAIGASTYGNSKLGTSHYVPNGVSTFLQLRIYHVNYDCKYRNSHSPKLHLIARGTAADAWGDAENLDIFTLYWLDGVPRPEKEDEN